MPAKYKPSYLGSLKALSGHLLKTGTYQLRHTQGGLETENSNSDDSEVEDAAYYAIS